MIGKPRHRRTGRRGKPRHFMSRQIDASPATKPLGENVTQSEEDFIKAQGALWSKALMAATISIRSDSRFVGMDKIREPAAIDAAFRALGYDKTTSAANTLTRLIASEGAGFSLTDSLVENATKAAKEALRKVAA